MNRWRMVVVAAAALLAACIAVPAQAAEWCVHDPQVIVQTPAGDSFTVYVTEGALGLEHQAALASAKISYTVRVNANSTPHVIIYDYIPNDQYGSFPTEMTVSSQPYGGGLVYGSTLGTSGWTMAVSFNIHK